MSVAPKLKKTQNVKVIGLFSITENFTQQPQIIYHPIN